MTEFIQYPNFIDNKYKRIYNNLISNIVENRIFVENVDYENHHILPKSMGGSNDPNNLIKLTLREHFICHQLLTKFTTKKDRKLMVLAFHTFFVFHKWRKATYNKNSRQYANHKKNLLIILRNTSKPSKDVFIFKNRKTGQTFEGNRQDFIKLSGLTSQEVYNLTSNTLRWAKQWGIFYKDKGIFSYEVPIKVTPLAPIRCENCDKVCSPGNYSRWHGKNCKSLNPDYGVIIPSKKSMLHKFKNRHTNEIFEGTIKQFRAFSKLENHYVHSLISKRLKSIKNWGIWYPDLNIFSYDDINPPFANNPKKKCEFCGILVRDCNYTRWHGDKCKHNK